jgi:hypothetical protein
MLERSCQQALSNVHQTLSWPPYAPHPGRVGLWVMLGASYRRVEGPNGLVIAFERLSVLSAVRILTNRWEEKRLVSS